MKSRKRIEIYDTTLRDGVQGAGVSFTPSGKLLYARKLDEFGIDYIEGGYPGSNPKDMDFFTEMAKKPMKHAKLAAFGSTRRVGVKVKDDLMVESLIKANTPVVTIFGKAWKLHVKDVLRTNVGENLNMISETVGYLKDKGKQVFFDAEHFFDGYREDPAFALSAVEAAIRAGADMVVLCDTNGGSLTHEIADMVEKVRGQVKIPLGIHTHNDSGLAVANTLEAVRAGVTQVHGTINGYGERCGNADLCSVIPALQLKMGLSCLRGGSLSRLRELSLFVDDLVNLRPNMRAPYVGGHAFSHKGGSHVNAVKKNARTFEHIKPEQVGNERKNLISELSGGSSILLKAIEMGTARPKSAQDKREILKALKELESKGYAFESADASFKILIQKVLKEHKPFFEQEGFRVIVEKGGKDDPCRAEATVKVRVKDKVELMAAEGDGPVNALDRALRKALARFYPEIASVFLTDFRVRILDPEESTAAKTRVLIESSDGTETWGTVGVSGNIIEASWEALVDSVEYKLFQEEKKNRSRKRGGRD